MGRLTRRVPKDSCTCGSEYSVRETCAQNIPIFAQHGSFEAPRAPHRKPRARVASDPAGPQPRAMKFGHRFQQVIEQTHPSVSDQVRSRAARHPFSRWRDTKSSLRDARRRGIARAPSARRAGPAPPASRAARELARDAARPHARALPDATPVRPPHDSPRPTRPPSSLTEANPPKRTRRILDPSNRRRALVAKTF